MLLLLPQRYKFSSKSQHTRILINRMTSCCCYRKGTNFQANHNSVRMSFASGEVVVATAKVQIFKQITTHVRAMLLICRCCCYRKGTNFQANHNWVKSLILLVLVVVATAKVQIFKQITT